MITKENGFLGSLVYFRIPLTGFPDKIILTKTNTNSFTHLLNLRKALLVMSSLVNYGEGSGTFNDENFKFLKLGHSLHFTCEIGFKSLPLNSNFLFVYQKDTRFRLFHLNAMPNICEIVCEICPARALFSPFYILFVLNIFSINFMQFCAKYLAKCQIARAISKIKIHSILTAPPSFIKIKLPETKYK